MAWYNVVDVILFVLFLINIGYLLVFSIASLFRQKPRRSDSIELKRIVILIPAYKEDAVIEECVDACIKQQYPKERYDVVVISDRMTDATNDALQRLPIKLIKVYFENSTKSKALNTAMDQLGDEYDIAVVLDADNIVFPDFLTQINELFQHSDVQIVQAHRCAKNLNTSLAFLDALSEEINNGIFRKGHVKLGFSAALIGSGMAFDYRLFKTSMLSIDAIGGFDRALELDLLREGKRIHYLPYTDVLDEKIQQGGDFSRQRRRWMSAQFHYLKRAIQHVPCAIVEGKWDFCDKVFQQTSIPRVLLIGFTTIFALFWTFVDLSLSIKWWMLLLALIVALLLAVPRKLYKIESFYALMQLPYYFLLMVLNLFRIKGANKKFIHTRHGVKE